MAAHEERVRARGAVRVLHGGELAVEPHFPEDSGLPPQTGGIPWRRYFRPVIGVAAAAAAVALLLAIPKLGGDDPAGMLRPLPGLGEKVRLRSVPLAGKPQAFADGVEAYERGDLGAAVDLLEGANVPSRLDNLRAVYLGSAYARLERYNDAARTLEGVTFSSVPDPWGGEGRWTLYVTYRALGRDAEAAAILEELAREPGDFGTRARQELNKR